MYFVVNRRQTTTKFALELPLAKAGVPYNDFKNKIKYTFYPFIYLEERPSTLSVSTDSSSHFGGVQSSSSHEEGYIW